MLALSVFWFCFGQITSQSWFWPPYRIVHCPDRLKSAEIFCSSESREYICSCYLLHLFNSDNIDVPYIYEMLDGIQIDENNTELAHQKKQEFVKAAKNALVRCNWAYRSRLLPMISKYRHCVYETLDRICKAEIFFIPPVTPYGPLDLLPESHEGRPPERPQYHLMPDLPQSKYYDLPIKVPPHLYYHQHANKYQERYPCHFNNLITNGTVAKYFLLPPDWLSDNYTSHYYWLYHLWGMNAPFRTALPYLLRPKEQLPAWKRPCYY